MIGAAFTSSAVVRADDFFDYLANGFTAPWLPESDAQNTDVIAITTRAAAGYACAGWTTVLEGIIGPWFLDVAAASATDANVELHYAVLTADLNTCLSRFVEREGTDVRSGIVHKMHAQFESETPDAYRIDASADPETVTARVLEMFNSDSLTVL
jgi:hypothetical protein